MPPSCRFTPTASSTCRFATRSSAGTSRRRRWPAATSITTSGTPTTSTIRRVLEAVLTHPSGTDPAVLDAITHYTKLFWIHTGPFNNLTARKFVLGCTPDAFAVAVKNAAAAGARLPLEADESVDHLLARLHGPLFDKDFEPVVTNKSPGAGADILKSSSNNLYVGMEMADLDGFEERFPLNSRLVKTAGGLVEEPYRIGGKYSDQIALIVEHLEAAIPYATEAMAEALGALVTFYRTGQTADRRAYDIAWVRDQHSTVDTMNGFIEVYMDARGVKGSWEALVYYVHPEKTAAAKAIAEQAQWFEDRMPWDRGTASRRSPASPPARSRWSWKAATRRR